MAQPPADVTAFACSLHAILATSPPSLAAPASADALPVLTQLLQPDFLNGNNEAHSVWRALQQLPPTATSFGGAARSSVDQTAASPSATISPHFALALLKQTSHDNALEALDDGSCCISCPFNPTSAEQIELAPHSITLTEVSPGDDATVREANTKWWELPWSAGKKLHRQKRLMARKVNHRVQQDTRRKLIVYLFRPSIRQTISYRYLLHGGGTKSFFPQLLWVMACHDADIDEPDGDFALFPALALA